MELGGCAGPPGGCGDVNRVRRTGVFGADGMNGKTGGNTSSLGTRSLLNHNTHGITGHSTVPCMHSVYGSAVQGCGE